VVKSKTAGRIAYVSGMINAGKVLIGKPEGNNYLIELGVDVRMILKWMSK
jgi:hypothetical protein